MVADDMRLTYTSPLAAGDQENVSVDVLPCDEVILIH